MANKAREYGFTLIELLVALSIFAVMSVMAYSGLNQVLNAREQMELRAERLAELQKAFVIIARDINQMINRPVRDEYGSEQPLPALMTAPPYEERQLEFTHAGWRNPLRKPRGDLQRVAYGVKEETLVRWYWTVLDRAQDSQPLSSELVTEVKELRARFRDNDGNWHDDWPPTQSLSGNSTPSALPVAIELSIELADWGEISRLFPLPGSAS